MGVVLIPSGFLAQCYCFQLHDTHAHYNPSELHFSPFPPASNAEHVKIATPAARCRGRLVTFNPEVTSNTRPLTVLLDVAAPLTDRFSSRQHPRWALKHLDSAALEALCRQ